MDQTTFDVIILGSGLAGLYAALRLAGEEINNKSPLTAGRTLTVLMLSKQAPDVSGSALAQGGVAAVLEPGEDGGDSFALHLGTPWRRATTSTTWPPWKPWCARARRMCDG